MLIDFEELPRSAMEHFKGGEKTTYARMYNDELNRIMKVTLEPGASIGLHRHETNSEIVFIISGRGQMITEGETEELRAGICSYCPAGSEHTLINTGEDELILFAVVSEQIETAD